MSQVAFDADLAFLFGGEEVQLKQMAIKMSLWFVLLLVLIGCTTKTESLETGSYCQMTSDNTLTYGPAVVKINPSFEYFKTSKRLSLMAEDMLDANVKQEKHIFVEQNFKKMVM